MPLNTLVDGYTYLVSKGEETGVDSSDVGGLFHRDTRYLSRFEWAVDGTELHQLQSTLRSPASRRELFAPSESSVNDISGEAVPKHNPLIVTRDTGVFEESGLTQTVQIENHTPTTQSVTVTATFETDFADLFEVRGFGSDIDRDVSATTGRDRATLSYGFTQNGTRREYTTTLGFEPRPDSLSEDTARFDLNIPAQDSRHVTARVGIDTGLPREEISSPRERPISVPTIPAQQSSHTEVIDQAAADLEALTAETNLGPVPLAGTPWFVTAFGRDALITAYQTLPVVPSLAAGTLRYLAAHRGDTTDDLTEEAPGKIFHEQRQGELAARGLVPHTPYYGTVDATPLWVLLLAEFCDWDGSTELAAELAPALADTLEWVYQATHRGDTDPFIYYDSSESGLTHKAWKDTADSIRNADGVPADRPLAVAEVQGYASAALSRGAALIDTIQNQGEFKDASLSTPLSAYRDRANSIQNVFDDEFWMSDRSFYAVAKTGDGQIVDSVTSNVGHCLWTGLVPDDRVDAVVETLQGTAMSGGWGLRTMSAEDGGYSPVSYHAGGVWPHDTSLTVLGLAKAGYYDTAETLGKHVLDAAAMFENQRLPELYCGFSRDDDPTPYPAACTPQAWGAGAPFAILRASFGLQPAEDGTFAATRTSELFGDVALDTLDDYTPLVK